MKIGFSAMSGIRSHDPELLRRGLTLPGFVERSKQIASLPSLGLLLLAGATPDGHELVYEEVDTELGIPPSLRDCDIVAISTFSAQIFEAYAVADALRQAGIFVAMGGLHVSVRPEEALEHADYVVVGEGENVWPEVVRAAESTASSRIFDSADYPPVRIEELPVPRYDLLGKRPYNRFTVQTTRGCPYLCEFCASSIMLKRPYRKRPVEHVVRDIRAILELRPNAFIEFADDNTFVDKDWGKALCRALIPLKIHWFTESDISVADDEELLDLLRLSGCRQLLIGLEAPAAGDLIGVETKSNFKARRAPDYAASVRKIQSHGITVNGCFVLGLDGQGPESFERIVRFVEEGAQPFEVQLTYQTAFPGTPLYERLLEEKRLIAPGNWELCTLFDVNVMPTDMSPEELRRGLYALSDRIYSAEAMERRRSPFYAGVRDRRASSGASRQPLGAVPTDRGLSRFG